MSINTFSLSPIDEDVGWFHILDMLDNAEIDVKKIPASLWYAALKSLFLLLLDFHSDRIMLP